MSELDERQFLQGYDITKYDRPSVTADVAVFTIRSEESDNYRRNASNKLSLLLVKRNDFPFKGRYALPGGFLMQNETLEECAVRKTIGKAGITPSSIMPVGTFSEIGRDPRGRIISCAYVSVITDAIEKQAENDDAESACWFDVTFEELENGLFLLTLINDEEKLCAKLRCVSSRFGVYRYEYAGEEPLAFDHSRIIASALSSLRRHIGDLSTAFDFLPEKFTLNQLQCVQETILDVSLLTANFRRKAAPFVEETDEYITGAGHRPAKLFRRRSL